MRGSKLNAAFSARLAIAIFAPVSNCSTSATVQPQIPAKWNRIHSAPPARRTGLRLSSPPVPSPPPPSGGYLPGVRSDVYDEPVCIPAQHPQPRAARARLLECFHLAQAHLGRKLFAFGNGALGIGRAGFANACRTSIPRQTRSSRAAHRHAVDPHRRNPDAHRHALTFLAAHADAFIQLQIVAHHADVLHRLRPVADQRRVAHRPRQSCRLRSGSFPKRKRRNCRS